MSDSEPQIEPRPAEWFWTDCRGRAVSSVSIRDGRILHAGLPAILNLRGDLSAAKEPARSGWSEQGERQILNQRRVVRWEITAELLPQTFQFGIWTGATSPVDVTGQPLATVPFSAGRGSYLHAFTQSGPLHLAVAAFDADGRGPEAEISLDWARAPPASPANQLARCSPIRQQRNPAARPQEPHFQNCHHCLSVVLSPPPLAVIPLFLPF